MRCCRTRALAGGTVKVLLPGVLTLTYKWLVKTVARIQKNPSVHANVYAVSCPGSEGQRELHKIDCLIANCPDLGAQKGAKCRWLGRAN